MYLFQRHGYEKRPGETIQEFALNISADNPKIKKNTLAFVETYYMLEYGRRGDEASLNRLLRNMENDLERGDTVAQ